jgi:hypothetical protein
MPGSLLTVGATVTCPHQGRAAPQPAQSRVFVTGQPVDTIADLYPIVGCPLNVSGKPQPCLTIRWATPATRVLVNGSPALLQSSTGICTSGEQVPQGPALVSSVQQRVVGI